MFNWFRRRRRRKILATGFPELWEDILRDNMPHDQQLESAQRQRLRDTIQIIVAEKNWEGCQGLELTEEIQVTIAAQAGLMVLGLDDVYFDHVLSILVYPDSYIAQGVRTNRAGVVIEGGQARQGEAWWRGPVILSWSDVLAGVRGEKPGHNLVIHEFAHQLDMMNGRSIDGTPPLNSRAQLRRWLQVMPSEYAQLVAECRRGLRGIIDCYGATNPAEFFAVTSETFFECPQLLQAHKPALFDELRGFYQVDPTEWVYPPRETNWE